MKSRLFHFALVLCLIMSCKKNSPSSGPPPVPIIQPPVITDFEPKTGAPGIPVQIWGEHFDTLENNLLVKFNGTAATIYSTGERYISVYVPQGVTTGKISVTRSGLTVVSNDIFTVLGGNYWEQKSGIPGADSANGRFVGIGFSVGNKGYMGLGDGNDGAFYSDLFQYDPTTDTWTQEASCPLALAGAICMVINNIAYVGLGETQISVNSNAVFAYDPATNSWTRKADFPGAGRNLAVGISIGNFGLVGLGANKYGIGVPDIWLYDPAMDSWTQKANFSDTLIPGCPVGFSLDNKTALVTGTDDLPNGKFINILYQYEPVSDTWTKKQPRPGKPMVQASTMIIDSNGYIMGGGEENWMYSPSTDTWTQVPFFTLRKGGASFVIGSTGYFGNGSGLPPQNATTDLWRFTP